MELTVLYRPVGQRQYELVEAMGFRRFLPRLPEQPFFYPVANEEYATQIAREWNGWDEASGWTGHVLQFRVRSEFLRDYPVRTVGSALHQEYWIPADQMDLFNRSMGLSSRSLASEGTRRSGWVSAELFYAAAMMLDSLLRLEENGGCEKRHS
jgi:hypothetical protein